jgi:hypothetical protein
MANDEVAGTLDEGGRGMGPFLGPDGADFAAFSPHAPDGCLGFGGKLLAGARTRVTEHASIAAVRPVFQAYSLHVPFSVALSA